MGPGAARRAGGAGGSAPCCRPTSALGGVAGLLLSLLQVLNRLWYVSVVERAGERWGVWEGSTRAGQHKGNDSLLVRWEVCGCQSRAGRDLRGGLTTAKQEREAAAPSRRYTLQSSHAVAVLLSK